MLRIVVCFASFWVNVLPIPPAVLIIPASLLPPTAAGIVNLFVLAINKHIVAFARIDFIDLLIAIRDHIIVHRARHVENENDIEGFLGTAHSIERRGGREGRKPHEEVRAIGFVDGDAVAYVARKREAVG